MKFWQKIFVSMLLLFVVAFDVGALVLANSSYQFNLKRETDSALREQQTVLSSLQTSIENSQSVFPNIAENEERLQAIVTPLAEYYQQQEVFFSLYLNGKELYRNAPKASPELLALSEHQAVNILDHTDQEIRYLSIASQLPSFSQLTFVYTKSIQPLADYLKQIVSVFLLLNVIICPVLGMLIYWILHRMTRPIRQMQEASTAIANGAYNRRVSVKSSDEIGELASNFNQMAEQVSTQIEKLQATAEQKQSFINDLSHEMRTPMTAILGYSEYLQKAVNNEEERTLAAKNLHMAAKGLSNLSQKLMEMTMLSHIEIEKLPVTGAALLEQVAVLTRPSLETRHLFLILDADDTVLLGEEALLCSLLTNLVENAARASLSGGSIRMRCVTEEHPVLEVCDEGCGIPQEELARITEPFYRVDKARSRTHGGVGLGLALCKHIVTLHDASLSIQSVPAEGTTVRIDFTTSS